MTPFSFPGSRGVVNRTDLRLSRWRGSFRGCGMSYQHKNQRHKTLEVQVGDKLVGGSNPIWVQSMTTTYTHDLEATVAEIQRMEEAGVEIVRVTVPKKEDAGVLSEIKKRIHVPLICDIHF